MIVYLASPYTHASPLVREQRFLSACRVAARLMSQGHAVFSPIAHSHPIAVHGDLDAVDHEFWMRQDIALLRKCDKVIVLRLPGWTESKGVLRELALAAQLNIPVEYVDE